MFFSKAILAASFILFGLAQADFYLGSASGTMEDGGLNTPSLDSYTTYILQIGDQDICDSSTIGGDPSQPSTDPSAPWTNFCGETMSNNSWNVMLDPSDTVSSTL
ncbi:hypothetical protein N7510_004110 [Penicillium lagena]|uniref:uncharacterized protein n=1 Tax=Penicillium lagena TaxID=94218 RepID=UPI0025420AE4|nr:uncharacterized protein N7510_004110 [Penicillium lagena]KAJ5620126.1 hypothetical protein N7510_004110 [Penicillium lagena]